MAKGYPPGINPKWILKADKVPFPYRAVLAEIRGDGLEWADREYYDICRRLKNYLAGGEGEMLFKVHWRLEDSELLMETFEPDEAEGLHPEEVQLYLVDLVRDNPWEPDDFMVLSIVPVEEGREGD